MQGTHPCSGRGRRGRRGGWSAVGEEPHGEGPDNLCQWHGQDREGSGGGRERCGQPPCPLTTVQCDVQWSGVPPAVGSGCHELTTVEAVLKDIWGGTVGGVKGGRSGWGPGEALQGVH